MKHFPSVPVRLQILAGAVVVSGELDAQVTATGVNSFFGKTMALLAVPPERGHLQQVSPSSTIFIRQ